MITFYTPHSRLIAYFAHLGIPLASTSYDHTVPLITVVYAPSATPGQIAQGNQILSTWDYINYQSRMLWDIF